MNRRKCAKKDSPTLALADSFGNVMKILMIAPQPFFQPRGTPFSVLHRLRALSVLGYEVDLLTYPIGQDVPLDGIRIIRSSRVPGIRQVAVGPSLKKLILDLFLFRHAVKLLKSQRYDVLHTHEEAGFMGIVLAKRFGLLHLYDMHSSLPQQLRNFRYSSNRLLVRLFEKLEALTIASANAVITICPELWTYVHEHYPETHNVLIENVADNSIVFDMPTDSESNGGYEFNGHPVVLYTGTFEPYQGIDLLVAAAATVVRKNPRVRFVLVGGKPEQVDHYRGLVQEMGLEEAFHFTGTQPPEAIPAFINKAQVLVSPRISGTNTPLKIYSYLRSGVPIVATRHTTHTQVLNPEVAVLTEPNPEAFAEGILTVLEDEALAKKLTERARRLAEEKYSYEVYLEKTKQVYSYLESLLTKGMN